MENSVKFIQHAGETPYIFWQELISLQPTELTGDGNFYIKIISFMGTLPEQYVALTKKATQSVQ
ncbi:hypothetical protein RQN30_10625 [Arcanobacterium hippocoleae]